jgi:HPt (histidine-containing phosphotransfer) domain-containing protein
MTTSESNVDATPIAYDELAARCLERIDFMERVLNSFSLRFAEDLQQLEREIEVGNSRAIALLAHRMKGACGNTAAHQLHGHVSWIERLAREERFAEIPPCLEGIQHAWATFRHAVTDLTSPVPAVSAKV